MKVYVDDTEADAQWFELWRCRSFEELRLKCAIYGVDCEQWLRTEGFTWIPRDDRS